MRSADEIAMVRDGRLVRAAHIPWTTKTVDEVAFRGGLPSSLDEIAVMGVEEVSIEEIFLDAILQGIDRRG